MTHVCKIPPLRSHYGTYIDDKLIIMTQSQWQFDKKFKYRMLDELILKEMHIEQEIYQKKKEIS